MFNICLRLRVACNGVKELARRLRFATTQVEVACDDVTTLHILSLMCQTVSMISALILTRVPGCDCDCDYDCDCDCDLPCACPTQRSRRRAESSERELIKPCPDWRLSRRAVSASGVGGFAINCSALCCTVRARTLCTLTHTHGPLCRDTVTCTV